MNTKDLDARDFDDDLSRGKETEELLNAVFSNIGNVFLHDEQWIVVSGNEVHDRTQGVDAIHINGKDVRIIHRVDYKLDSKATSQSWHPAVGEEGQLSLEDYMEDDAGRRTPGWVHTSKADRIVSYVPAIQVAYCMILKRIRELWEQIKLYPAVKPRSTRNGRYWLTVTYLAPVNWLRLHGVIERETYTGPRIEPPAFIKASKICWHCDGTGQIPENFIDAGSCRACSGKGRLPIVKPDATVAASDPPLNKHLTAYLREKYHELGPARFEVWQKTGK